MRFVSYALILVGLIYLADAAYDQYRGIASVRSPSRSGQLCVSSRSEKPVEFHNLMAYQWTRGSLVLLAGMIIYGICRREDRLDPFSPDLQHSNEDDDI